MAQETGRCIRRMFSPFVEHQDTFSLSSYSNSIISNIRALCVGQDQ